MATPKSWHSVNVDTTLENLSTTLQGLSCHEAATRLKKYGLNRIPLNHKRNFWQKFAGQFKNVLIYTLLAAAFVTILLGNWVDTGVILGVVLINASLGLIQEGKAEKAMNALKELLPLYANVRRSGKRDRILAEHLVPGDIVLLGSGDKVPADLRLAYQTNLQIQEAILTGESIPAEKSIHSLPGNTPVADRTCIAYLGTFVTYGTGIGIVVNTGRNTEIGRISSMLSNVPTFSTPLICQLNSFAKWLAFFIVIFSAFIFLFGLLYQHYPVTEMFVAAVAIAVSAIPEGLPAIITIIFAVGVTRMAHHKAIIRRLPAVETLSSVTVICTDKTGTLTANELTVQKIILNGQEIEVSGSGYNDKGTITINKKVVNLNLNSDLIWLIKAGVLCNDAELNLENSTWKLCGNPVDGALIALGLKAGMNHDEQLASYPRTDVIPFDSVHKFMATLHHDHQGSNYIFVKGAPERIVEMCLHQLGGGKQVQLDKHYWFMQINSLAETGMRLLALAYRPLPTNQVSLKFKDVEKNLTFIGLVGIIDPPREGAEKAVRTIQNAGIRVKMVTGDHPATARSAAKQVGIFAKHLLLGQNIDAMDNEMLAKWVDQVDVFARTTPEHKIRLITALRKNNHVIAMTGDGVNDAPALRHADIGIAMGKKGTDVAKEAAEIILSDDNFISIRYAVEQGRVVYENLKKVLLFSLPTNGAEAFSIFLAILLGYTLPISPLQVLWVNMVTAVTLGIALAFELPEKNLMSQMPRKSKEPLLSKFLIWRIIFISLLVVCSMFGLFVYLLKNGTNIALARTIVVNLLVLAQVVYLMNCRYIFRSVMGKELFSGTKEIYLSVSLVLILQIAFTYLPFFQKLFATRSMDLTQWMMISIIAILIFLTIELEKLLFSSLNKRKNRKSSHGK